MAIEINKQALADYEAICAGATAGPWVNAGSAPGEPAMVDHEAPGYTSSICDVYTGECGKVGMAVRGDLQGEGQHLRNAEFIASSRTMGPFLASKVRELEAEIEQIAAQRDGAVEGARALVREIERLRRELVDKVTPAEGGAKVASVDARRSMSADKTHGTILPPTGEPFAIVGTEAARAEIEAFRVDAVDLAEHDYAPTDRVDARAAVLLDLLSHRDHLASQVTELQASNARFTERARVAELDAIRLAASADEWEYEDMVHLEDGEGDFRDVVARVLHAAGRLPKSPATRALTGEVVAFELQGRLASAHLYAETPIPPAPLAVEVETPPHSDECMARETYDCHCDSLPKPTPTGSGS